MPYLGSGSSIECPPITGQPASRCHAQAAAEHLGHQLHRQHAAGPADQVDRHDRPAAHRVNVRERVGRGDPAPVVGIVDDGSEEVGGGEHREVVAHQDGCRVVAAVQADQHVCARLAGEAADRLFELAGRDLAGAASTVGIAGEPDCADAVSSVAE